MEFRHDLASMKHGCYVTFGLQRNLGVSSRIVVVRTVLIWFGILSCLFMLLACVVVFYMGHYNNVNWFRGS
ncbi:hypothetical protein Hanom_Chr04g00347131 [Helianthus anomalus]